MLALILISCMIAVGQEEEMCRLRRAMEELLTCNNNIQG
jgi:hypothetical protein